MLDCTMPPTAPTATTDPATQAGPPMPDWALQFNGVRLRWPGQALDTLQLPALQLQRGEYVFLRGPSGCGKSTLLALAAGVLLPSAGEVRLLGHDWQQLRPAARDRHRADHLGVVFQQFNLLPYLSVLDNVRLPLRFSARRARAAAPDAAQQLLQRSGLRSDLWSQPAGCLSVGQQQRVAAARALIGGPEVVLADEPTSALDEPLRAAFMALLMACCAEAGAALLFVSHDDRLADRFHRVLDLPSLNQAGTAPAAAA
jgi:putative ABC transport system ATP-binding protein